MKDKAARVKPVLQSVNPRRLDGRLDPDTLGAGLRHGFCIVRRHLTQ
jgi:hypothetical protein